MVDTAMGRCEYRFERTENEIRERFAQLSLCAGGNNKLAYAVTRACADILDCEGEERAVNFLLSLAEAFRAGDKDEVDHNDGWDID